MTTATAPPRPRTIAGVSTRDTTTAWIPPRGRTRHLGELATGIWIDLGHPPADPEVTDALRRHRAAVAALLDHLAATTTGHTLLTALAGALPLPPVPTGPVLDIDTLRPVTAPDGTRKAVTVVIDGALSGGLTWGSWHSTAERDGHGSPGAAVFDPFVTTRVGTLLVPPVLRLAQVLLYGYHALSGSLATTPGDTYPRVRATLTPTPGRAVPALVTVEHINTTGGEIYRAHYGSPTTPTPQYLRARAIRDDLTTRYQRAHQAGRITDAAMAALTTALTHPDHGVPTLTDIATELGHPTDTLLFDDIVVLTDPTNPPRKVPARPSPDPDRHLRTIPVDERDCLGTDGWLTAQQTVGARAVAVLPPSERRRSQPVRLGLPQNRPPVNASDIRHYTYEDSSNGQNIRRIRDSYGSKLHLKIYEVFPGIWVCPDKPSGDTMASRRKKGLRNESPYHTPTEKYAQEFLNAVVDSLITMTEVPAGQELLGRLRDLRALPTTKRDGTVDDMNLAEDVDGERFRLSVLIHPTDQPVGSSTSALEFYGVPVDTRLGTPSFIDWDPFVRARLKRKSSEDTVRDTMVSPVTSLFHELTHGLHKLIAVNLTTTEDNLTLLNLDGTNARKRRPRPASHEELVTAGGTTAQYGHLNQKGELDEYRKRLAEWRKKATRLTSPQLQELDTHVSAIPTADELKNINEYQFSKERFGQAERPGYYLHAHNEDKILSPRQGRELAKKRGLVDLKKLPDLKWEEYDGNNREKRKKNDVDLKPVLGKALRDRSRDRVPDPPAPPPRPPDPFLERRPIPRPERRPNRDPYHQPERPPKRERRR